MLDLFIITLRSTLVIKGLFLCLKNQVFAYLRQLKERSFQIHREGLPF